MTFRAIAISAVRQDFKTFSATSWVKKSACVGMPLEFANSAIEGSISIPLSHLNKESDLEFIQKESLIKEIFTICQSGKRSEKASKILSKFKIKSRSIEGGIEKVKKILCN